ncbi:uncharacterized protein V2V93DRAFT_361965 [Kockiozyma suomiensis]|uniref:uncharacterized protein n=1 Tax=Kockiozyma suomiensis TaxID=1337062 RepID=UPI0033439661
MSMIQTMTQPGPPATPTVVSPVSKHTCPHCAQSFTRHHNLKSHLLTHSHEKPFTCTTCNSKFRRLHDLKRHSKLHTGEKPYVCSKCGRKFARGDALARHGKGANGCAGRADGDNSDEDDEDDERQQQQHDYLAHKRRTSLPAIRTQDQPQQPQKQALYQQSYSAESPRILSPLPHAYQQQPPPPPPGGPHHQPPPGHQQQPGAPPSQSPASAALYSNFGALMPQNGPSTGPGSTQSANAFLQNQPYLQAQAAVSAASGHHHSTIEESLWGYVRSLEDRLRESEERLQRAENRIGFLEREIMSSKR